MKKKMMSMVGETKVDSVSDGVAPDSVEGAKLGTNTTTSRGQSPQKGRKPMNMKKVRMTKTWKTEGGDEMKKSKRAAISDEQWDTMLKALLLEMARRGEPRPKANTILGQVLKQFTTKPN